MRLMGRNCRVEVSGLTQRTGLVLFHLRDCELCYTWRFSPTGMEMYETEASRQYTDLSEWQRSFWLSEWIKTPNAAVVARPG